MVVELDGHSHVERRDRDQVRDEWMRARGIYVHRVPVWEFSKYKDNVVGNILRRCRERAAELLTGKKDAGSVVSGAPTPHPLR